MNVYDFAMKMELDGKAYYEQLAAETPVAALKNIFRDLAADEQKHYEMIRTLKEGKVIEMAESTALEKTRNLFDRPSTEREAVGGLKNVLDGYRHARKIEADSIRLYEDMAQKEDNPEARRLIMKIVDEERNHFTIMDNICDFVQAPQNYLAWGEFSNLREL